MELQRLLKDDDAVSPVVGVILMVAISIILAAVTGSFVLGLGDQANSAPPQASFEYEYRQAGNGNLTITHTGGDTIDPSRINISTDEDFHPAPGNESGSLSGPSYQSLSLDSEADGSDWVDSDIRAGTSFGIVSDSDNLESATVRIVYVEESGSQSTTLATWEGPDA